MIGHDNEWVFGIRAAKVAEYCHQSMPDVSVHNSVERRTMVYP
jgi:hypothetical protein